jgi:metal-sulfur cluster biosynthetic enzyme
MKENANPTVYKVTGKEEREESYFIATKYLKRLDCQEASKYDSLFHLDPDQILTSVERSVQCALNSIDQSASARNRKGGKSPLEILHKAGIKTRFGPYPDFDIDTRTIHRFKPIRDQSSKQKSSERNGYSGRDPITQREIFDIIRNIQDPEHPLALEQLNVVSLDHVQVHDHCESSSSMNESNEHSTIDVRFTPTIPHCSMATLIGLCIRVKLLRSVPTRFKVIVRINPGTHASEFAVNRQLNDKERVIAALENVHLLSVVNKCIANGMKESD